MGIRACALECGAFRTIFDVYTPVSYTHLGSWSCIWAQYGQSDDYSGHFNNTDVYTHDERPGTVD